VRKETVPEKIATPEGKEAWLKENGGKRAKIDLNSSVFDLITDAKSKLG
jgi:hypothetical protein